MRHKKAIAQPRCLEKEGRGDTRIRDQSDAWVDACSPRRLASRSSNLFKELILGCFEAFSHNLAGQLLNLLL
jgi:hypothetical protein